MKAANRISKGSFNRLVFITIIAVYLVILAGGIVRSTGSGMGCPDWPKCFGNWIPPTTEAQLPADYRESFAQIRVEKNKKLAGYLERLGFKELAAKIQAGTVATPEATFNKYKTWTEYINRLLGVILGFFITVMAVVSSKFNKNQPAVFYGSLAALLLVVFQGWIGSVVVSTNLLPGMVTFHMVLAVLLIGLLIYLYHRSSNHQHHYQIDKTRTIKSVLLVAMALLFIQIAVGTQVREAIDVAALELSRDRWIDSLGGSYYFHRTFSLLLLAVGGYVVVYFRRLDYSRLSSISDLLFILVIVEVILGIVMAYFGVPAWVQPLHLLIALLIPGLLYWLYLSIKSSSRT